MKLHLALERLSGAPTRQVDGEGRAASHLAAPLVNLTHGRAYQSRGAFRLTARSAASSRLRTCSFPSTLVI